MPLPKTLPLLVTLIGLYLTSLYNYLLFHSLAEVFSIVIACGIFMVAWNARSFLHSHFLLFLGIAYLFVGGIDLLHSLAFKGMDVFKGYDANLPTQLWIGARYMQAFSLLLAACFVRRTFRPPWVFLGYIMATGLLLTSIFTWRVFPDCFVEGVGLTPFKIFSEYIICLIMVVSIGLLVKYAGEFDRDVLILLVGSILAAIASELAFTTYLSVYGFSNLIGHLLKIVSFYLVYRAIIETGLVSPYKLLFRNLKQSEEALRKAHQELEEKVLERTLELAQANQALAAREDLYRSLFENSLDGILITDPLHGGIFSANPAACRIFGGSEDEICALGRSDLIDMDDPAVQEFIAERARTGKATGEIRCKRLDGTIFTCEQTSAVFMGRDGKIRSVIVVRDVSERKKAEEQIRQYTARLEQSNEALQDFAFIASHDMQEPLRKVSAFGDRLKQDYSDSLGEEGRDFLNRMLNATERMQSLLEALLDYSRVTTKGEPFKEVELAAVLREVLSDLEVGIEETGGELLVGELPVIQADPTQMRQLFQNLIGNALKFHKEGVRPIIEVRSTELNNEKVQIVVEDNGIGFEEKDLQRIFAPFHRLHGRSAYTGAGMGLAICSKIVERHKGNITARSSPGQGSTFIVTLPFRQAILC